jgi:hypothetical protein
LAGSPGGAVKRFSGVSKADNACNGSNPGECPGQGRIGCLTRADNEGGIVLHVDLKRSDQELSLEVTTHCSEFGVVNLVKIHRGPKDFALVEMSTHNEALNLAAHYRRTSFGSCVLLYLEQKS